MSGMRPSQRWLIPAALCFLGLAVVFALIEVIHSGSGPSTSSMAAVVPTNARADQPASTAANSTAANSTAASPTAAASPTPPPSPTPSPTPMGTVIHSAVSGMCLDADPNADPVGASALQATCDGDPHQRWTLIPAGNGASYVVNVVTGKCLDVAGADTGNGVRVQTYDCNQTAAQQWRQQAVNGAQVYLVSVNSGRCLDLPAQTDTQPGTHLQQWDCLGNPNQLWTIG